MNIMSSWMKITFFFCIVFSFLVSSDYCSGQYIEVFAIGQQMKGDQTTASGVALEVADNTVGGFGAGFNIDKFNLNLDFLFGSTELEMGDETLDCKLSLVDVNLDYSLLTTIITPVITAGLGSVTFSDSFTQIETLNETDFSYNVGAGLKGSIAKNYLIKALYRATWTKIKETDDPIMFNGISIYVGYIF